MSISGITPSGIVYGSTFDVLRSAGARWVTEIAAPASATWPTGDLAIAVPYILADRILVKRLWLNNGTAVGGNVDVAIYDRSFTKLVGIGSTAQSGTSTLQYFDVTDTYIGPGLIYIATVNSGTTGTTVRLAMTVSGQRSIGIVQMAAATGATGTLPTTFTPATVANAYVPHAGFTTRDTP